MKAYLVKKVTLEIPEVIAPKEDKLVNLSLFECSFCRWQFYGAMHRCGHGSTFESKQTPNYCPGCGIKLDF